MKKTVSIAGKQLTYSIKGAGKPVMLVHGFAEDGKIWNNIVSCLENNYRFIIPDLPGSGESELLDKENIVLSDYADCLHQLILAEDIEKISMIGHSMGGYIILAFAEKYPGKISTLGLFHSSAFADDESKIETRRKGIQFIREHGAFEFLRTTIPGLFYDPAISAEQISLLTLQARNFSPEALVQYYEAMMVRPDRTEVIKHLEKPVLIIAGKHDKAVPLEASLRQTILPAYAYLFILKKSGHMGMLEETGESVRILGFFLENT